MVNLLLVVLATRLPSSVTFTLFRPAAALIVKRTCTVLELVHARRTPATPIAGLAKSSLTIVPVPALPIAAANGDGPAARPSANVSFGSIAVSPITGTFTLRALSVRAKVSVPLVAV